MEIKGVKMLTYSEVKDCLNNVEFLNLRSKRVKDFLDQFEFIDKEKIEQIKEDLRNLNILRLKDKERAIIQLINFMPTTEEEVRVVLAGEHITLPLEDIQRIVEVIKKYK
jgi:DNA-directed RNA polymerase subunit F